MTTPPHVIEAAAGALYEAEHPTRTRYTWGNVDVLDRKRYVDQAQAALSAGLAALWQPIETAPKDDDGWPVLAAKQGCNLSYPIYWRDGVGWLTRENYFGYSDEIEPVLATHWMPLPQPPEAP
jgi:hypothetical protein